MTTSADRQSQAKQPETQEGSAFETGVVEILHPERGEVVVEVGLKDVRARRNRFRQVEQAFHELEAAHPEIIADPNDDLSIQDPELEQILREHNARQTGPRAEGNDPEDPGEEKG